MASLIELTTSTCKNTCEITLLIMKHRFNAFYIVPNVFEIKSP